MKSSDLRLDWYTSDNWRPWVGERRRTDLRKEGTDSPVESCLIPTQLPFLPFSGPALSHTRADQSFSYFKMVTIIGWHT